MNISSSSSGQFQPTDDFRAEAVDIMVSAIRANVDTVITGQIRADGIYRNAEPLLAADKQFDMVMITLRLDRVFVQRTLRSRQALPPVIYLQAKVPQIEFGKPRWDADLFADDSVRVLFMLSGQKLLPPRINPPSQNAVIKTIAEFHDGLPAPKLFEKLGVDRYLNATSWLQLYADRAAIRVDLPKPALPPVVVRDTMNRVAYEKSQRRADENYFQTSLHLFQLEGNFPDDLKLILDTYGTGPVPAPSGDASSSSSATPNLEARLRAILKDLKTATGRDLCNALIRSLQ